MRFTITPEGDNLLPVVERLPSDQVGRLEGYNGVGKTLAATVLQICTGTQPLVTREQQARWEGLRDGLGRLTVIAEELADGRTIRWRLDSRLWPVDVTKAIEVTNEWFEIEIDGASSTLDEARRLLAVERIAGNEGLLETLADEADAERAKVDGFAARIGNRREALEHVVGNLVAFLRPVEPGAFSAQADRVAQARVAREDALAEFTAITERVRGLQEAVGLRDQLAELEAVGPDLDRQVAALVSQIAERQRRSAAVLEEIKALSPTAAQSEEALQSLQSANRSLKRANTRLKNASDGLARLAARAGLSDPTQAEEELKAALAALDDAQRRRKALTSRPEMLELVDALDGPLRVAQNRELGGQIVLIDQVTPGREWTVDEVYEALGERRETLRATPASPAVEEAEREIERLTRRVADLRAIPQLRADLESAQRAVRTASSRVRELNAKAQNPASDKIQDLESELDEINNELIALGAEQARLDRRRQDVAAGRTAEDLAATLQQRLVELGVATAELEDALSHDLDCAEKLQTAFGAADERLRRENADLASLSEQVNRLTVILHERDEFEWLTADGQRFAPFPADDFEAKLGALERLARATRVADARLEAVRQTPLSVSAALGVLARELRGAREDATPLLVPAMRTWLERHAANWFADETVRDFVLPDAEGDVVVDLEGRRVLGRHADGSPISKPLEGFSSGEQAFAFTQAQLALLDHRPGRRSVQRLVILDEFGAFIASEGRQQLARQLRNWAEAHPLDRLVLILPTTQDYEALAASASGDRRKELLQHAADLSEHQYFVAPFED
jgi:hypothetical protein